MVMVAIAAAGLLGCRVGASRVVGIRSPEPLAGEEVSIHCRDLQAEVLRCRVEQRWNGDEAVEALPPQPPTRELRGEPAPRGRVVQELAFEASASLARVAPIVRHPLTSEAYGLRSCAYRGGCGFDFAVLTTSTGVPVTAEFDGVTGYISEGVPGPGKRPGYWLKLRGPDRTSAPGGPFVGAGVGWRDGWHPRTTVGWAMYAPDWAEHALALELEPGRVQLVPTVSAVSGGILFVPSVGFGIGVPFRLHPEAAAGGRVVASFAFPYVTIFGTLDVFPRDETWAQPSIMAALSL